MKKSHKTLLAIAAVQIILWVGLAVNDQPESERPSAPIVKFALEQIDTFTVSRPDDYPPQQVPLDLRKVGGKWVVPNADNFEVETAKVEKVLTLLTSMNGDALVARSKANHNTLNVGVRTYSKQITLSANGETLELVIGEGKGRSTYVRRKTESEVYLIKGITAYDLSHEVTSYVEPEYFSISDLQDVKIEINGENGQSSTHLFQDENGQWVVDGLQGAAIDESRVRALLIAVRSARMVRPAGQTLRPEFGLGRPRARVIVKNKDTELELLVGNDLADFTYIKVSEKPYVVLVRKYTLDALLKFQKEQLIDRSQTAPSSSAPQSAPSGFISPTK